MASPSRARCGCALDDYDDGAQRLHLATCDADPEALAAEAEAEAARRAAVAAQQDAVQDSAAWEFLGRDTSDLYLLGTWVRVQGISSM